MRYQLVTTTYLPGQANDAALAAAYTGRKAGLEGYWLTEIGPLNQTVELWSQQRTAPEGIASLDQTCFTLSAIVGPKPPDAPGGVYEMRRYALRDGMTAAWVAIYTAALPARERYSRIVGLFASDPGEPDQVVHLWGYPDLNARAAARAAALKDPTWQTFLRQSRAERMVVRQDVAILLPAGHSPLK
jgi:hypothetical protein